MPSLTIKN